MEKTSVGSAENPDEPAGVASYAVQGKSLLYRLGGARYTTDVVWSERRLVFPYFDRIWRVAMLAGVWLIVWWLWTREDTEVFVR